MKRNHVGKHGEEIEQEGSGYGHWKLKISEEEAININGADMVKFLAGNNVSLDFDAETKTVTINASGGNANIDMTMLQGTVTVTGSIQLSPNHNLKTLICRNSGADITLTIPKNLGDDFSVSAVSEDSGTRYVEWKAQEINGVPQITLKAPHGTKLLSGYPSNLTKRTGEEIFNLQGELTP